MISKSNDKDLFKTNSYITDNKNEFKFTELIEKNNFNVCIDIESYIKENIRTLSLIKKSKRKIDTFISNHLINLYSDLEDNFNNFRSSFFHEFDYFKLLNKGQFKNEDVWL